MKTDYYKYIYRKLLKIKLKNLINNLEKKNLNQILFMFDLIKFIKSFNF